MRIKMNKIYRNKYKKIGLIGIGIPILLLVTGAVASAATANTTINAQIQPVISVGSSTTVALSITPASGGSISSASDTVTVNTNDSAGYNLTLSDGDTNTSLVNGVNTITAHSGTQAVPTTMTTNNKWGYRVDNVGGFGAGPGAVLNSVASSSLTWAGVPSSSSPNTLKSPTSPSGVGGDTTTVWYATRVDQTIPSGTYTDTVTYTATTK
jgi:hypothetical protein